MFNQEQLAAIAAAVSILKQSMQSNGSNPAQNRSPASLPVENELLLQHLGMASGYQAAATASTTTTPITSTSQTSPFMDQLRLQYNRTDLSNQLINQQPLSNNSYPTATNLQLEEHQQQHQPQQPQQPQPQQQQASPKGHVPTLTKPSRPISYSAILRNALNNQVANTNIDISNANNPTGSSLGQTNGSSSLLKQRNSDDILSLEPTLDGYTPDYPILPAQQFFNQQNNSFRHNQVPNNVALSHQSNSNHSNFNTDIVFNTNSRDKGAPTFGRATNIDIFNTNNLTGGSLGQTNGSSSLLKQRNSNDLLSLKPTLDGYTPDYPTPPAQQFFNQHNNSLRHNQVSHPITLSHQSSANHSNFNTDTVFNINPRDKSTPTYGRATNLLGFMGLYVGNLSQDLSKEQLEKIFSKYGEPVKAHRLIRSPVAFIKYENTESPRAAIDDLYGVLLPELTLNPDQPLKLHFDRNDAQLKANYRPIELPKEDNGECYGWRTTVCKRGKSCPKKHIPINRGIDFQMWMIKSSASSNSSVITTSTVTP